MPENSMIPLLTADIEAESAPMCNARYLHAALQIGTRFDDWMRRRIEDYGFEEGMDYAVVQGGFSSNLRKTSKGSKGGRPSIDYHLTLDMAKELAMIENNEIGRGVRRYFIRAEQTLREKLLAELREKAAHVLPVRGVKLMRDGLSMRDTLKLQERSRLVLRQLMTAPTQAERKNLHLHFRQINLVLGVPTIEFDAIEAEISRGQPALEG